ncbi:MAG: Fur family transcriptional regulator [Acidimicrobiia bacterium]
MRSPVELTEAFRQRGLKVTPQRQCIFRILNGNSSHPSAEAVYEAAVAEMPTISLRTVYQTLNDLADMGEIQALDLGTGSARFDPMTEGHSHTVCIRCGAVRDVLVDVASVQLPHRVAREFSLRATEVVFRGVCNQCESAS